MALNETLRFFELTPDLCRHIFDFAPVAMVAADQRGKIALFNSRAEQLFGYGREEVIGQAVEVLIPERVRRGHVKLRENFVAHPEARPMGAGRDLYGRNKDGTEFPIEVGLNPIATRDGLWIFASIVDITERKLAEEALRESEERFRSAFRDAGVGILMVSLDAHFLAVNAAFCEFLGYSEQELIGRSIEEVTYPEDTPLSMKMVQRAQASRASIPRFEKRYIHKNGEIRWAELTAALVRSVDGEPKYFVTYVLDITERKRSEEAFRASEIAKGAILESLKSPLAVIRPSGEIAAVNTAWEQFGIEKGANKAIGASVGANYLTVCKQSGTAGCSEAEQA